jgi:hypothetical protein
MPRGGSVLLAMLCASAAGAAEPKQYLVRLAEDENYTVTETKTWNVQLVRAQPLHHADIKITPKTGKPFKLMLYFKSDTHAQANFDSVAKMKEIITYSSQNDLKRAGVQELSFQPIDHRGRYGAYAVITNAVPPQLPNATTGPFKFTLRGMVRLSTDAALGFSLQINEQTSPAFKELLDYILNFVQPAG